MACVTNWCNLAMDSFASGQKPPKQHAMRRQRPLKVLGTSQRWSGWKQQWWQLCISSTVILLVVSGNLNKTGEGSFWAQQRHRWIIVKLMGFPLLFSCREMVHFLERPNIPGPTASSNLGSLNPVCVFCLGRFASDGTYYCQLYLEVEYVI